ncbi:CG33641 [Drosophila busckii]|uniref:CG33641 n=1 Tax=Drosophila busckii TaxID=30019 RepID=A0A0M4E503_DROBS|nr:CG33641 [Drosophila busckii]
MNTLLWSLVILSNMVYAQAAERNFRFVLDNHFVRTYAADIFEEFNCKLLQKSNRSFINCNMLLKRNVEQLMVTTIFELTKANKQTVRLINVHLDACKFLETVHKNRLYRMLQQALTKNLKGNPRCPLISHFNYTLTKWHLNELDFPSYVPQCKFLLGSSFYVQNKMILKTMIHGRVVNKQ